MTMSLRGICFEVRQNIRCANVFLEFDQCLTTVDILKINIDDNSLQLRESQVETRVALGKHFTVEAQTISNLAVNGCNASFRLSIDNIALAEQVGGGKATMECRPQLAERTEAALHCKNCKCSLTGARTFERIREFPSGSIDMGEFFCHHGPDFKELLLPQPSDLFYGYQFVVLNRFLLETTAREKESHVYCRRCLQYLGETLLSGKAYKLWADTLCLQTTDSQKFKTIFSDDDTSIKNLLHKIVRESTIEFVESPVLLQKLQFSKVLLQAAFPNRQSKYILMHILEKQLQVLRNTEPLTYSNTSNDCNNNVRHVQLQQCQCFKLLFQHIDEDSSMSALSRQLLDNWQRDLAIQFLKVSPTLFNSLWQELLDNSQLLADNITPDGFQLSYVFY